MTQQDTADLPVTGPPRVPGQHRMPTTGMRRIVAGVTAVVVAAAAWLAWSLRIHDSRATAAPMTTPWTDQVSPDHPLPEYPRPQLTRPDWQSLNGRWQFAEATSTDQPPVGRTLAGSVLVPYPVESRLSGVHRHADRMWYRRLFTVPDGWAGRQVQLNFGAVNWQATVWVNGQRIGEHSGAWDAFALDVTSALHAGDNELIVGVWSPVDSADIPVGKQRLQPSSIWYTAASGIWQTVWLEPTTLTHITRVDPTPDLPGGAVDLVVQATASGAPVHAEVLSNGHVVGSGDGTTGTSLRIPVPNAHLWSPADPFLYDLKVSLTGTGGGTGDTVGGYFGMRSIGTALVGGVLRPVLNGNFVFQLGLLDQGYWPDGLTTAPTDEALAADLRRQKDLGFNTVRKHMKVEPARWYHWADRLGLLVWQDMPALPRVPVTAEARSNFESELHRMVDQLRGVTAVVQWQPFNEGWGQYDGARITDLVRQWDPSRLVDNNSGFNCCGSDAGNGSVVDSHNYTGPGTPAAPDRSRVAVLGEFGGFALRIAGHEWSPGGGFGYTMVGDGTALTRRYVEAVDTLAGLITARGLSGAIYTQPTDVENEVNGLVTYDRQLLKVNAAQVRAANAAVLDLADTSQVGDLVSLQATTPCCTDRYLRHSGGVGVTSVVDAGSDTTTRQDATFWLRAGLADRACLSFESRNYPGNFLRHAGDQVRNDHSDGSAQFAADATFCRRTGHTAAGVSLESYNLPGRYLRHINATVWLAARGGPNPWDAAASWPEDTTWQLTRPWWRSGADLTPGAVVSLQVVTAGATNRYLRVSKDLAVTTPVTAGSDAALRTDATFVVRPGLADASCVSLESRGTPGRYLRHAAFRLRMDPGDGGEPFARDATFCAQSGRAGGDSVTLASYNLAAHAIRHVDGEVWLGAPGAPRATDGGDSYDADASWRVTPPLSG